MKLFVFQKAKLSSAEKYRKDSGAIRKNSTVCILFIKNLPCELLPTFALHALRGGSFDPKISCFSLTRSQIYRTISDRSNLTNNSVQRANPGVPTGFVQSDSI